MAELFIYRRLFLQGSLILNVFRIAFSELFVDVSISVLVHWCQFSDQNRRGSYLFTSRLLVMMSPLRRALYTDTMDN